MNHILKLYYGIEEEVVPPQYFHFQNQFYYFFCVQEHPNFIEVFQYYRYLMNQYRCGGFSLVKNYNQDIISHQHMLLLYHECDFDFPLYLSVFLQPINNQRILVSDIKEQWIQKIDCVKELVKHYAYSFKHNPELVSLIYYYSGIAENCIIILNEILAMNKDASLMMGLSLDHPVSHYVYDLLNPIHYVISTRMRHIVYLLRSQLLPYEMLKELLETQYFDVYEILYLYARLFFPSTFFNEVLKNDISQEKINEYYLNVEKEREIYIQITHILSFYVSLPKISWINRKNMV